MEKALSDDLKSEGHKSHFKGHKTSLKVQQPLIKKIKYSFSPRWPYKRSKVYWLVAQQIIDRIKNARKTYSCLTIHRMHQERKLSFEYAQSVKRLGKHLRVFSQRLSSFSGRSFEENRLNVKPLRCGFAKLKATYVLINAEPKPNMTIDRTIHVFSSLILQIGISTRIPHFTQSTLIVLPFVIIVDVSAIVCPRVRR